MNRNRSQDYREVYSTDKGSVCPNCSRPTAQCSCAADRKGVVLGDGRVRVRRETKGRAGKTVTAVSGLPLSADQLQKLLSELKRLVGGGGALKDGVIELQGDHCELVMRELIKRGYPAKRSGG